VNATEATKLFGMYLCHAMQAFNLGAGAESISDECDTVFMKFLEWFMCGI